MRLLAGFAAVGLVLGVGTSAADAASSEAQRGSTTVVRVGGVERAVAATSRAHGFLGLATELNTIPILTGTPIDPDLPFRALVKNLSPGAPPLLRLGGNSADFSQWPTPGLVPPRYGLVYTLTPQWGADVHSLLAGIGGQAIIGLNLELAHSAGTTVTTTEAADFDRYVGSPLIDAFEVGNEPEFYPWTQVGAAGHGSDPTAAYDARFATYGRTFTQVAAALGGAPVVGPGTFRKSWTSRLGTVLGDLPPTLRQATVHGYALYNCSHISHLSVRSFFAPSSIAGLAARMHSATRAAAARGLTLRLDEINGITCGGAPGFSNSFAEALWALNVMPALWRAGVAGVNFQTIDSRGNVNQVITAHDTRSGWRVSVEPVYYGLLAFADATPAGSRLLQVDGRDAAPLYRYAVRAPDGSERVVLTNVSSRSRTVLVHAAGARGTGSLMTLAAPSISATHGTRLGGQTLSARSGELAGAPHRQAVRPGRGRSYRVRLGPGTAGILTLVR